MKQYASLGYNPDNPYFIEDFEQWWKVQKDPMLLAKSVQNTQRRETSKNTLDKLRAEFERNTGADPRWDRFYHPEFDRWKRASRGSMTADDLKEERIRDEWYRTANSKKSKKDLWLGYMFYRQHLPVS